jgi:microcystin-dependent protein
MNKINFLAAEKFPLSTDGMELMQQMINLSAGVALLGGDSYILSGCEDDGNGTVSAGVIVLDGELLTFDGGAKKAKITVEQTLKTLNAFGVDYPEAYVYRKAVFSATDGTDWDTLTEITTLSAVKGILDGINGDPVGVVKDWAGLASRVPENYLLCDGSSLSIAAYPELYAVIGFTFGGAGSEFKLPDTRGRFTAGYDNSRNDYKTVGLTGGEESHTLSVDEIPAHDHVNDGAFNKLSARAADATTPGTTASIDSRSPEAEYNIAYMTADEWQKATIQEVGGSEAHENRPPFIVFAKIIKYK